MKKNDKTVSIRYLRGFVVKSSHSNSLNLNNTAGICGVLRDFFARGEKTVTTEKDLFDLKKRFLILTTF